MDDGSALGISVRRREKKRVCLHVCVGNSPLKVIQTTTSANWLTHIHTHVYTHAHIHTPVSYLREPGPSILHCMARNGFHSLLCAPFQSAQGQRGDLLLLGWRLCMHKF